MIIRAYARDQFLCITQPDHAHLSRRVMEHCPTLRAHPRAASILLAIGEHDNGWSEPDAAPIVDSATGRPFDFVHAPADVRQGVWPRGVARLAHDPWAAALVANHAVAVYDRYRGNPEWSEFFPRLEALRDEWLRASGGSLSDLLADYRFVRLGDLISLVFCTGWTDALRFQEWAVSRSGDDDVVVTPDPFEGATIAAEVTARKLPDGPYRDDADLRGKLESTGIVVLKGRVSGR